MSQLTKIGEEDKAERILKKLRKLQGEISQVKKNQAQIKKDMGELKNRAGYSQPSEKLKVVNREVDANGELQKLPANKTIKAIREHLKKRGGLETSTVQSILEDQGWRFSRRHVRRKMERIAEVWDWIELQSREEREKSNSNRLIDTRIVN